MAMSGCSPSNVAGAEPSEAQVPLETRLGVSEPVDQVQAPVEAAPISQEVVAPVEQTQTDQTTANRVAWEDIPADQVALLKKGCVNLGITPVEEDYLLLTPIGERHDFSSVRELSALRESATPDKRFGVVVFVHEDDDFDACGDLAMAMTQRRGWPNGSTRHVFMKKDYPTGTVFRAYNGDRFVGITAEFATAAK